jgi:hypothetical protein
MSRIVLAIKLLFLTIFSTAIYEAVSDAYNRVAAGGPPVPPKAPATTPEPAPKKQGKTPTDAGIPIGAVTSVLSLLQREARFIDFLMEDIEAYSDAQVGTAARGVHRGCRKALEEYIEIKPVRTENEGDSLTVEAGFDPYAVRLVGNLTGEPPYNGVLRHHGWRVVKANLPQTSANQDIVMPAEVEI